MRLIVQGQTPLKGHYTPAGNSNEAIALIVASLLSREQTSLQSVPQTEAVRQMVQLAEALGAEARWLDDTLTLKTPQIGARFDEAERGSAATVLLLAPILAERQHATLKWQDSIGRLHTHLTALRDLDVKIDIQGNTLNLVAQPWDFADIILTETSVTATALICMLSATLGGETILHNAASEPHLRALCEMLVKMGAGIEGIGSNRLRIFSNPNGLSGAEQRIQPSHTEIASIAAISAITPGHVTIQPVIRHDLQIIHKVYERLGINLIFEDDTLHVPEQRRLMVSRREEDVDVEIDTAPWPGFPSDLVAITAVVATQAKGTTLIHEKLFNNRLLFVDKLKSMGAQIVLADPHRAIVIGDTELHAEYLDTPDVRIGMALLAAALCAEGEVIIDRAELIERHFEGVFQKIIQLGAQITFEE